MVQAETVVVFSHLRWNSVFQRPHHLLTRLARHHQVLFIEEPSPTDEQESRWNVEATEPGVIVCTPHTPCADGGFCSSQLELIAPMLPRLLDQFAVREHIAWFYTPLAWPLVQQLAPLVIVYDSMDALDQFLNAPPQLKEREQELLSSADVVFTGGPSLYRRLESRHENLHCFPSSVDAAHFARARDDGSESPRLSSLPRPRCGYFGVIDERLDLDLIDHLARSRPDWQIAMVGPVVKISPDALPQRENIHYFGQQPYADLPGFAAGWDVCIMPFARNESTRYISPTKVLEYMAAERPIVSTPITDVAEPYGEIIYLADSGPDFVAACDEALAATQSERARRAAMMRRIVNGTSWDTTVENMRQLIAQCRAQKDARQRSHARHPRAGHKGRNGHALTESVSSRQAPSHNATTTVVIGAGPTGLSATYHLAQDSLLLEQNQQIGGWCRSLTSDGFTFDFAGHIMFSNDPYVHDMYKMLLGDNVHWQDREAWIYSKNVYTRYPFQGALYGLPADVIKECIMGAIESRYALQPSAGDVAPRGNDRIAPSHANAENSASCHDCCADGILEATARLGNGTAKSELSGNGGTKSENGTRSENFEDFIYRVWGRGIAKHFAIPYNQKLWAVPLHEMETSWLGGRVPMPDLEEMLDGALHPVPKPMGPNARFGYPLQGGFQALIDGFEPYVQDRLRLDARVVAVSPTAHTVTLSDGEDIPYGHLISTMPLPVLIRSMGAEAPPRVREAAAKLRYVSVRCVHLGIGRENLTDKHWIYYPEDTVFHRIFVQGNASPHCNPPGGFGLTCEITYSPHKRLPCDGDALIERAIDDCRKVGIFTADDPIWTALQVDLPFAYVVYDHDRPKHVKLIREWLATQDIVLAGRYSEWEYYNSDHAFLAGKKAADSVTELRRHRRNAQPHLSGTSKAAS